MISICNYQEYKSRTIGLEVPHQLRISVNTSTQHNKSCLHLRLIPINISGSTIQLYLICYSIMYQAFAWLNEDMKSLRRNFLPPDLEPYLHKYGMDGTVAVQARQCDEETQFLLDLAETYPNIVKGVVGWVDLRADYIDEKVTKNGQFYRSLHLFLRIRSLLDSVILYSLGMDKDLGPRRT